MAHTFDASPPEAEAGRFLSYRLAWPTEGVPGQPMLYREALSQKIKKGKEVDPLDRDIGKEVCSKPLK